jgi:hypothetical protein
VSHEMIVVVLTIIALIWTNLRLSGKIMILEYRVLLVTEALAEMEGSTESKKVAAQTREEIKKKHWFLDALAQR